MVVRKPALAHAQSKVAEALRLPIVPEEIATPYQRQMGYANLSVEAFYRFLRDERALLLRFATLNLATLIDPSGFVAGSLTGSADRG